MFVGTVGGGIGRGVGFVQKMRERVNREGFDLYLFHCFLFILLFSAVFYNILPIELPTGNFKEL